jgi:hypothetical protein
MPIDLYGLKIMDMVNCLASGGARGGQRGLSPLYEPLSPLLKIFEKYSFSMKYKIEHFLLFLFVNCAYVLRKESP